MSIFEAIAERHITAGQEAGLFDNLAGAGKPIPDLDRERPPGWFAARLVRRERSRIKAEELEAEIRLVLTRVMRLGSEADVRTGVRQLNSSIAEYNRATQWTPRKLLDTDFIAGEWRRLRSEL